jgi:hypothetical protein
MITETCLCPVHPSAILFLVLATASRGSVKAKRRLELAPGVLYTSTCRSALLAATTCFPFLEDPPYLEGVKVGRIDYLGFGLLVFLFKKTSQPLPKGPAMAH